MAYPTLASYWDLEQRLPTPLPVGDAARALAALEDASSWIRAEAAEDWLDDDGLLETVPGVIKSICVAVARRVLDNAEGFQQESIAGYSYTRANSSTDVYLTKAEKAMIRKAVGTGGMVTVTLQGPYTPPLPYDDRRGYDAYPDWYTAQ